MSAYICMNLSVWIERLMRVLNIFYKINYKTEISEITKTRPGGALSIKGLIHRRELT